MEKVDKRSLSSNKKTKVLKFPQKLLSRVGDFLGARLKQLERRRAEDAGALQALIDSGEILINFKAKFIETH